MKKEKITIFDTTLRDGEQSAGASMSVEDKVSIASKLDDMKVDVIEAGFPFASKGDFEAVEKISRIAKYSTICGLARAQDKDIEFAGKTIKDVAVAPVDRTPKSTPFLANRKFMERMGIIVNPDKAFVITQFDGEYDALDSKGKKHAGINFDED